jgi:hypothetical protein
MISRVNIIILAAALSGIAAKNARNCKFLLIFLKQFGRGELEAVQLFTARERENT